MISSLIQTFSFQIHVSLIYTYIFHLLKIEWLYQCIIKKFSLKLISIAFAAVTLMVIWSEMTFFSKRPVLSIFAIFLNSSRNFYNYFLIEVISWQLLMRKIKHFIHIIKLWLNRLSVVWSSATCVVVPTMPCSSCAFSTTTTWPPIISRARTVSFSAEREFVN